MNSEEAFDQKEIELKSRIKGDNIQNIYEHLDLVKLYLANNKVSKSC